MKTTTSYDKAEIMKNAWRHYNCCINITFGEALSWAWNRAKEERAAKLAEERRMEEYKAKYSKRDAFYANSYKNVVWGKTDYRVSYGRRWR